MCDIENSEHFGELSLIFGGKRTATVTTRESCFALVVKKKAFNLFMKEPMF